MLAYAFAIVPYVLISIEFIMEDNSIVSKLINLVLLTFVEALILIFVDALFSNDDENNDGKNDKKKDD